MFLFLVSILILTILFFWKIEKKTNFLYSVKKWYEKESKKIRNQTELKIDVFKTIIAIIFLGVILYVSYFLVFQLYSPYFDMVLDQRGESIVLEKKDNESSLIGDWGAFGDFIGGTLNPVIGFLSIILLFITIFINNKMLKTTTKQVKISSKELRLNRKANQKNSKTQRKIEKIQKLQYLNNTFFEMLEQLNKFEANTIGKEDDFKNIYNRTLFGSNEDEEIVRFRLKYNSSMAQYFSFLYQIIKVIESALGGGFSKKERYKNRKYYGNILRANIPVSLMQLLMVNVSGEFKVYRNYIKKYSLFEHMPFYHTLENKGFSIYLISLAFTFDVKSFGDSAFLKSLLKREFYKKIKENEKAYLSNSKFIKFYLTDEFKYKRIEVNYSDNKGGIGKLYLSWSLDAEVFLIDYSNNGIKDNYNFRDVMFDNNGVKIKMNDYSIIIDSTQLFKVYLLGSKKETLVRYIN